MYLCDKGSILVLPIEYVKKIIKERMFIMNSKNKKIIKERMFTMNLKNKKIFSRIAAGVMTVAMAITLLPGTMKTVNAAEPVTSASLDVNLYKRADVYAPNTTFEFEVTNLTAEQAKNQLLESLDKELVHEKALKILAKIRKDFQIPVVTDIHSPEDAVMAAEYVDILQIPAFLCRQTDLLVAAAKTGRMVNIKKGQFLSPDAMRFAVDKVRESGNENVMVTERGTTFGYQDLVVDYRGIKIMQQECQCPVVVDVTHSLQQPNQSCGVTGGQPQLIETIAKAGIAVGADGIFIETHPDPKNAKSDGANMLRLDLLEGLLEKLVRIRKAL